MTRNPPMQPNEMNLMNIKATETRLYDKTADASSRIGSLAAAVALELADLREPVSLSDYEAVRAITLAYTCSCAECGTVPSKIGLSRALGVSRQRIDVYLKQHPDSPTAQFLTIVGDAYSQVLTDSALAGTVQQIPAIFIAKSIYGYIEANKVEISTAPDPYSLEAMGVDADKLAQEYIDIVSVTDTTDTN